MAKSYRTAFIRVTAENETTDAGCVIYTSADIEKTLAEWSESAGITYWFIEHTADEEVSKAHFHIVIKFKSPTLFDIIKNRFPYGKIENARNIKATVQYLIHLNDKSKKQYNWDQVLTNCKDMTPYKVLSRSQQEITMQTVYEAIERGEIREYNVYDKVPIELFACNKTKIDNALIYFRERRVMDKNRDILVIFISGATGLGKTTFAKSYCEGRKLKPCISSSSNDPLQDYKGEPVLILDDMRDDSFKFHDFLKLLDNHTLSSSKSRYHNKHFIGDTIIITSTRPLYDWYYNISREDKRQLYRRINQVMKFTEEKIEAFTYDDKLQRYVPAGSAPNIYALRTKELAKIAVKIFDAAGIEFTPADRKTIDDAINGYTDEQWDKVNKSLLDYEVPEATDEEKKSRKEYEESLPDIDWENVEKHRIG